MADLLEAQICDIHGEPVAGGTIYHTIEGGGLSVRIPLNDSRTATVTISAYDKAARHARVLDRVLSITYGPYLIFKGQILQVTTDFAAGTCDIAAMDASLRLKHHYHRYGDRAVDHGYPIDGLGMRRLIESAIPSEAQLERDVPNLPIQWGNDTTTHQPEPPDGIHRKAKRHYNVWESVINLSQLLIGPDFRLRPCDEQHPGGGTFPLPGVYARLDTADVLGDDLSETVIFEHGLGQDSAENLVHEPDGELVRNHFTQVYPGGKRNRDDDAHAAFAANHQSQEDFGLMEGLESSGQTNDSQDVLQEKARAMVQAYHRSPDFFTVTPRLARPTVPQYLRDWDVGDTIRARARRGGRDLDVIGRIVTATISAADQAGNARADLECVPSILSDFDPDT